MAAEPTPDEIAAEVAALKEIRDTPTFRKMSFFNDNNYDAICAQIETLESRYGEEEVYDLYEDPEDDDNQHVLDNAMAALQWMNGEGEDGIPSAGWEGLY